MTKYQINMRAKKKAPNNRTLIISNKEKKELLKTLLKIKSKTNLKRIKNKIINQDIFDVVNFLPDDFIDLLFIDPPYNLNKKFNSNNFKEIEISK